MEWERLIFVAFGILFLFGGMYLWIHAVILQRINEKVRERKLLTTGVYGYVRNPVYSAFYLSLPEPFFSPPITSCSYCLFFLGDAHPVNEADGREVALRQFGRNTLPIAEK